MSGKRVRIGGRRGRTGVPDGGRPRRRWQLRKSGLRGLLEQTEVILYLQKWFDAVARGQSRRRRGRLEKERNVLLLLMRKWKEKKGI
jgi:hypothetical protein